MKTPASPQVHSPTRASPSAAAVDSAAHPFTRADRTTANPLTHAASGAVPGCVLLHFPAALPSVHSSAHAPPSTVAAGFTAHSFTHSDQSTMGPHVDLASGAVPGLAFTSFPTTLSGYTFAPHSAAAPGSAHAGTSAWASFRAEITPRNALVHAHLSQGHLT